MSERCTKAILRRFTDAVYLMLKPHSSNKSIDYGSLENPLVDALSIDLYNSRGYVRLEVATNSNIILQALMDDVIKCYAKVYFHDEEFMEGSVVDLRVLKWSTDKSVVQFDIDLSVTEKEWER